MSAVQFLECYQHTGKVLVQVLGLVFICSCWGSAFRADPKISPLLGVLWNPFWAWPGDAHLWSQHWEVEAGKTPWIQAVCSTYRVPNTEVSQGYIVRPCLKTKQAKQNKPGENTAELETSCLTSEALGLIPGTTTTPVPSTNEARKRERENERNNAKEAKCKENSTLVRVGGALSLPGLHSPLVGTEHLTIMPVPFQVTHDLDLDIQT